MSLHELNHDQIISLKQDWLSEHQKFVSYEDLSNADELVSMEQLEQKYGECIFVEDDFWN